MTFFYRYLPLIGPPLQVPFKEFLQKQKQNLHHKPGTEIASVSIMRMGLVTTNYRLNMTSKKQKDIDTATFTKVTT